MKESSPVISVIRYNPPDKENETMTINEKEEIVGCFLRFSRSFLEDDLPNRFVKGMNRLIELHGGEIVKEVF